MISCREFIPFYSELFTFLEKLNGEKEVLKFWEYLSDTYVAERLGEAVREEGIKGCYTYWAKSLNEEACDFVMTLDEENQRFDIDMLKCPSKTRLLECKNIVPYHNYCGHCAVLYSRVLKRYGISGGLDLSNCDKAQCYEWYKFDKKD